MRDVHPASKLPEAHPDALAGMAHQTKGICPKLNRLPQRPACLVIRWPIAADRLQGWSGVDFGRLHPCRSIPPAVEDAPNVDAVCLLEAEDHVWEASQWPRAQPWQVELVCVARGTPVPGHLLMWT